MSYRRARPTPDDSDYEDVQASLRLVDATVAVSDADAAVCALAYFSEAVRVPGSYFALPPLWPMIMAAAAGQSYQEAAYYLKVMLRFTDRLTEIDFRDLDDSSSATALLKVAGVVHGAFTALRVLRAAGDPAALAPLRMPLLEELHGHGVIPPQVVYELPKLRRLTGYRLDCARLLRSPPSAPFFALEALLVATLKPAELIAVLDAAPNITELELTPDRFDPGAGDIGAVIDALCNHPAAARLRHLVVESNSSRPPATLRRLTGFVNLETYCCIDLPGDLSRVVNSCPTLRHFEAVCVRRCQFTDLSFLSRIVTLVIGCDESPHHCLEVFDDTDWSTVPSVLALRHLTIDFGTKSTSVAARFVHPLLETFDIKGARGRSAQSTVFNALCQHRPQLRVLRVDGVCPNQLFDDLLSRCGPELRRLSLRVSSDKARDGWHAVVAHCPKLVELYCNFMCSPDGSEVVGLLSRCRRVERLSVAGPGELEYYCDFIDLQNQLLPLTVRRKLALQVWNPRDDTDYFILSDGMDQDDRDFEPWQQMQFRLVP